MQTNLAAHDTNQKRGIAMNHNPNCGNDRTEKQRNSITRAKSAAMLIRTGIWRWRRWPPKPVRPMVAAAF